MVKLAPLPEKVAVEVLQYERYLPTAFNDELTLLEKINKLEKRLNELEERLKKLEGVK